jgi:chemotaxis protein MotB
VPFVRETTLGRRRRREEHENHERWLVSYADFITLLFAFFVVMYSVSSVNEGKFRVLSDSLVATFNDPKRSLEPVQIGELVRSPSLDAVDERSRPVPIEIGAPGPASESGESAAAEDGAAAGAQQVDAPMADIDTVAAQVQERMAPLIEEDLVKVRRMDEWLEVEFNTSILFESGAALLSGDAVSLLTEVASLLKAFPNPIQVEGFTDDIPIRTPQFPSNWELSAARAASVVHLFTKVGIRPQRMVAIGYGEHRPVADNQTSDGRSRNRRVVLVIPAADDTRRILDLERLSVADADPPAAAPGG